MNVHIQGQKHPVTVEMPKAATAITIRIGVTNSERRSKKTKLTASQARYIAYDLLRHAEVLDGRQRRHGR